MSRQISKVFSGIEWGANHGTPRMYYAITRHYYLK